MNTLPATLAFIGSLGWTEVLVLALFGVLIFGRRLPEVGRSIGKSIVEFKKGLAGIEDDVDIKRQLDRPAESPRVEQTDAQKTKEA